MQDATRYIEGNCMKIPFGNESFDAVLSNGSLHEWEDPVAVFNEIGRVLKTGGRFCIADMRRDVNALLAGIVYRTTKPKEIRPGFLTSLHASYTVAEISQLLAKSGLRGAKVKKAVFGLLISGQK
jgi:ubiquinone/menaquinone biosynthesis C-methylase UbiE